MKSLEGILSYFYNFCKQSLGTSVTYFYKSVNNNIIAVYQLAYFCFSHFLRGGGLLFWKNYKRGGQSTSKNIVVVVFSMRLLAYSV